jgi:hypothetical protein
MPEYKVTSLVNDTPKEWNGPHGVIYYHSVNVEGHPKAISVGKKEPNTIKVGDTIYGDINPTDYLEDKFKASPPPQGAAGSFSKTDGSQYLKDLSDLPLRVYTSSVGLFDTQALVKGGQYYTEFVTYIQNISNDLLLMAESIRSDDHLATAKKVLKEEKEPLPLPPEDLGDPGDYS